MIEEIAKQLDNIEYGWEDKDGNIHLGVDDTFADNYVLQSPDEVLKNKVGVCWDQVELERKLFEESNISFNTYFIVHYDEDKCPTHTFLIYKDGNKYYWFEHAWEAFIGIHEYETEEDAIKDIKDKFIERELHNEFIQDNLYIYKYDKPKYEIGCLDFYKHCEAGITIKGI